MWYYYLNNPNEESLMKKEKIEENNLIIGHETENRKYTVFENYLAFLQFLQKTPQKQKCFYEIIDGSKKHIPYFDVDIVDEKNEFSEEDFIKCVKKRMEDFIPDKQLLVYTSHNLAKKSFHFLVRGVYIKNHKEMKNFFNFFIKGIREEYRSFFDSNVYKSIQQFRTLFSHKYGKNNEKIFRKDLSFNYELPQRYSQNIKGENNYTFLISLITNTMGCEYLEGFEEIEEEKTFEIGCSSMDDVSIILDVFYQKYHK